MSAVPPARVFARIFGCVFVAPAARRRFLDHAGSLIAGS